MIILLSPAKKMSITCAHTKYSTQPQFLSEAETINAELKKMSKPAIQKLMAISDALTKNTSEVIKTWSENHTTETATEAILAFSGHVFEKMNPKDFTSDELKRAQKSIRILSGFYGILRPLDLMKSYRFEMGYKTTLPGAKNPYDFWKDSITASIKAECKSKTIVNLASGEYSKAIDFKALDCDVITPVFLEHKGGTLKTVSVYAKAARGLMTRYIIKNNIQNPDDLVDFCEANYRYDHDLSTDSDMVFIREP